MKMPNHKLVGIFAPLEIHSRNVGQEEKTIWLSIETR